MSERKYTPEIPSRRNLTDDQLLDLWREHPKTADVARISGYSQSRVRHRLAKIRNERGIFAPPDPDREEKFERLASSVPTTAPGGGTLKELKVSVGGNAAFNKETQTWDEVGLDWTGGTYRFPQKAPNIPLVGRGEPIIVKYAPAPAIIRKTKVYAIISDIQAGWLRHPETKWLTPIHDPTALDVGQQIVADVQPDGLIFIGDQADWQFCSRWRQYPEYDSANPSIKTAKTEMAKFCSASGERTIGNRRAIGSNHGDRPELWVVDRNMFMAGICRGGDASQWPVFSEPYLLQYDDLGVEPTGHYGSEYWITDDLVCIHAPPKKGEFDADVFHGHTHHLRMTPSVLHGMRDGVRSRRERFVYDTGCLCRVDATTDKRRLMLLNVPSNQHRSDWTQGIVIITVLDGKFPLHSVEQIRIQDGVALYGGKPFTASAESYKILNEGVPPETFAVPTDG